MEHSIRMCLTKNHILIRLGLQNILLHTHTHTHTSFYELWGFAICRIRVAQISISELPQSSIDAYLGTWRWRCFRPTSSEIDFYTNLLL